jgi:hypothetical protein
VGRACRGWRVACGLYQAWIHSKIAQASWPGCASGDGCRPAPATWSSRTIRSCCCERWRRRVPSSRAGLLRTASVRTPRRCRRCARRFRARVGVATSPSARRRRRALSGCGRRSTSHDRAAEHVEHRAAVDLSGAGRVPGDVGAPQPVPAVGDEAALHSIVVRRGHRPSAALAWVLPPIQRRSSP